MNDRCRKCTEYRNCQDSFISWIFFIIGIVAAVAIRLVTILGNLKPLYGEIAWYIGVLGFLIFFVYKFNIERRRKKEILKRGLQEKITNGGILTEEDRQVLSSLLCSLTSNKDKINYFLIFFTSAIALLVALYFDFLKR
ncbi:MAG: hypothetical protein N2Z79_02465 [Candidatus Omnitrophica bacterium]|nr:hypothetical protein [Candidatus Omnitrophota bacterium]